MSNEWNYHTLTPEETDIEHNLAQELAINTSIASLLVQRGIDTIEKAKKFFRPQLSDLYDPFLMKDMDKAVDRLNKAMGKKEKILIYGDYDVDGTTAVSLVYKFLRTFYTSLDYYIPDRYDEGYGISKKGIDYATKNKITLIIALDCGIKAIEKIAYAKEKGIDFIICDHHMPDEELPDAVAILDPKRKDASYPYQHLSGCGVGFKFMQGFAMNNGLDIHTNLLPLLDLVAVSIASDIVPITDENRIMAYHGLKQLNNNPSLGLQGIIDLCGLRDKDITISDIVFKIGPRINASGRMMCGKEAVDLLTAKDWQTAKEKSESINQYNENRKELDKKITEEATAIIDNLEGFENRKSIVIYNENWHKGVIGIVASRLTELHYRPAVVLTLSNGLATGSARSVQGFDVYKAIESCRDIIENFGGHTYAAGLSLKVENIPLFMERFEKFVTDNILPVQMVPQHEIDAVIGFKDITPKFFKVLKQLNPFGPGNPKPVFCTKRVFDFGTSRLVGRDQEHLKLELVDSHSENIMNGIAFGMHEHNEYIKGYNPFDICYTIEENNYNGNSSIQLLIKDIKPSDE
jgi:single-stranded-DNA-specific exonuclease RecJ